VLINSVRTAVLTVELQYIKIRCLSPESVHNSTKLNVNTRLWRKKMTMLAIKPSKEPLVIKLDDNREMQLWPLPFDEKYLEEFPT
jgi:hypothetical protein